MENKRIFTNQELPTFPNGKFTTTQTPAKDGALIAADLRLAEAKAQLTFLFFPSPIGKPDISTINWHKNRKKHLKQKPDLIKIGQRLLHLPIARGIRIVFNWTSIIRARAVITEVYVRILNFAICRDPDPNGRIKNGHPTHAPDAGVNWKWRVKTCKTSAGIFGWVHFRSRSRFVAFRSIKSERWDIDFYVKNNIFCTNCFILGILMFFSAKSLSRRVFFRSFLSEY